MLLYRLLAGAALALYSPWAVARSVTGRRRLGDIAGRLGRGPLPDLDGGIWIHAVSVGELAAARSVVSLLSRRAPGRRVGLSVTTAAGWAVAHQARGQARSAEVFWFPLELAGPIERTLSRVRPGLILLTETELWPLFLDRASARGIPVALVNGRISERSFRRYRALGAWFAGVIAKVSRFAMQSEADAERVRFLGAAADRVLVTGNVKYDVPPAPAFADAARVRAAAAGRPIVVAASTGEGEEEIVLDAWKPLASRCLLVLAPRRPERFDAAAELARSRGSSLIRRSAAADHPITRLPDHPIPALVYLLDSIGELASVYREATLAFIGGTFTETGGHNPIEAWAQGVPVVTGPRTENIRELARRGSEAGILTTVRDGEELSRAFADLLGNPEELAERGERARKFAGESRGAASATLDFVLPLLDRRGVARAAAP